jgi:hypothetical protein
LSKQKNADSLNHRTACITRYAKTILTTHILLMASFSFSQKPVVYFFSEVGLTLYIPSDFKVLDAEKNEANNQKGLKMLEESNHVSVDISQTKTLIAARKSIMDYYNVTITPYDLKKDGSYQAATKQVNDMVYKTFHEKLPNAKIDTATGVKNIGGLTFKEFRMKIQIDEKVTMSMGMLARYYKGYDLGMSYLYTDDITKGQIQSILQSCKFSK